MEPNQDELISSLFDTQYEKLCKVGYHLTGDTALSEDLVQTTFLIAVFRQEYLAGHPNQEGWLMQTLKNLVKNERRRSSNQNVPLALLHDMAVPGEPGSLEECFPAQLGKEDRKVLIWRFEQRLEFRDIADLLGISQSGSRSRVARAVKRCGALMKEEAEKNLSTPCDKMPAL